MADGTNYQTMAQSTFLSELQKLCRHVEEYEEQSGQSIESSISRTTLINVEHSLVSLVTAITKGIEGTRPSPPKVVPKDDDGLDDEYIRALCTALNGICIGSMKHPLRHDEGTVYLDIPSTSLYTLPDVSSRLHELALRVPGTWGTVILDSLRSMDRNEYPSEKFDHHRVKYTKHCTYRPRTDSVVVGVTYRCTKIRADISKEPARQQYREELATALDGQLSNILVDAGMATPYQEGVCVVVPTSPELSMWDRAGQCGELAAKAMTVPGTKWAQAPMHTVSGMHPWRQALLDAGTIAPNDLVVRVVYTLE